MVLDIFFVDNEEQRSVDCGRLVTQADEITHKKGKGGPTQDGVRDVGKRQLQEECWDK